MRRTRELTILLATMVVIATQFEASAKFADGDAVRPMTRPLTAAASSSTLPSDRTTATVDSAGVSSDRGRRVSDLLSDPQRTGQAQRSNDSRLLSFANDPTAYVDRSGEIFFVEQELREAVTSIADEGDALDVNDSGLPEVSPSESSVPPWLTPFALNSRPSSTKTIYIDFDGESVAGTIWNTPSFPSVYMPPFSRDADPALNGNELIEIWQIWRDVADDFAPFDVNVTTQRPGPAAFNVDYFGDQTFGVMAVVSMGDKSWLCTDCGGIAYLNVFDRGQYYGPAWVLPSTRTSTAYISSTVSHEVGHNFGLHHDGTQTLNYYGGHGNWGPIMGASARQFTQWSKGEYAGANNFEDDTAIIGTQVGIVADESSSVGTAKEMPTTLDAEGERQIIGFPGDTDFYSMNVADGYLYADTGASGNALKVLSLYNAAGQLIYGPVTIISVRGLPPGRYFVGIQGSSYLGNPSVGFSTYGSLGFTTLFTRQLGPPRIESVSLIADTDRQLAVSWVPGPVQFMVMNYTVKVCSSSGFCLPEIDTTGLSATFTNVPIPGRYTATITARHQGGVSSGSLQSAQVAALGRPGAPVVTKARFQADTKQVTIQWNAVDQYDPVNLTSIDIYARNPAAGSWALATTTNGSALSSTFPYVPTTGQTDVELKIVGRTAYSAPWNQTPDSNTANIDLARDPAPQVQPPTSGSSGRTGAPQVQPRESTPRGTAPQA